MRMAHLSDEQLLNRFLEAERLQQRAAIADDATAFRAFSTACDWLKELMDERNISVPIG